MSSYVHTTSPEDAAPLARALARNAFSVIGLCAAWCDSCGAFRADFERLAADRADATFVWLDIEDDAEVVGDVEVENFPTIAVYRDGVPMHFGASLPQGQVVARVLSSIDARSAPVETPDAVTTMLTRLGRQVCSPG